MYSCSFSCTNKNILQIGSLGRSFCKTLICGSEYYLCLFMPCFGIGWVWFLCDFDWYCAKCFGLKIKYWKANVGHFEFLKIFDFSFLLVFWSWKFFSVALIDWRDNLRLIRELLKNFNKFCWNFDKHFFFVKIK